MAMKLIALYGILKLSKSAFKRISIILLNYDLVYLFILNIVITFTESSKR